MFLATLAQSSTDPVHRAALVRISQVQGEWKADVIQEPVQQMQYRLDHTGHVLYACIEGYCELSAEEIVHWKPGLPVAIARHRAQTGINAAYAQDMSVVWRDRFGCIWWRGRTPASYQCPSDPEPINLPASVASLGFPALLEMADGTIGIPSYGKLALGRPGNFRVLNGSNGCPNVITAVAGKDESLWISTTSGLYVLPLHTKMELSLIHI